MSLAEEDELLESERKKWVPVGDDGSAVMEVEVERTGDADAVESGPRDVLSPVRDFMSCETARDHAGSPIPKSDEEDTLAFCPGQRGGGSQHTTTDCDGRRGPRRLRSRRSGAL